MNCFKELEMNVINGKMKTYLFNFEFPFNKTKFHKFHLSFKQ